jgi:hypothetical protein
MGTPRPRYVQSAFSDLLHERSEDHPLTRTLCGSEVGNFTRCTPEQGFKLCGNCKRLKAAVDAKNAKTLTA